MVVKHDGKDLFIADESLLQNVSSQFFEETYWQNIGAITGQSQGRGTAWFLHHCERDLVLRHYRRGGAIRKLSEDKFIRAGVKNTRAFAEFTLLQKLVDLGLPVPRPAAARMRKHAKLFYSADILLLRIANAKDVFKILETQTLPESIYQAIGATIARFHEQNVHHSDLNCHNIMLDDLNKVWLIDFDKCGFKESGTWKQDNLNRLLRSFRKEKGKNPGLFWSESDGEALLQGYRAYVPADSKR